MAVIKFAGAPIFRFSKRQAIITTSTRDAELIALHVAMIVIEKCSLLLKSLGWKSKEPIKIYEDSLPLIHSLINGNEHNINNARIINRFNTFIQYMKDDYIDTCYVKTANQLADMWTKSLGS